MEIDETLSKEKLLSAISEIFKVILISGKHEKKSSKFPPDYKISLNIIKKQNTAQNGVAIFMVKMISSVNIKFISLLQAQSMPHLSDLMCSMQVIETESHLAIDSFDENEERHINSVIWIDTTAQNEVSVKIMKQKTSSGTNHSVLQMRIFMSITSVCECAIEVCELMERFKMMNPLVQFCLNMDFGGFLDFQLCNSVNVTVKQFNIYTGLETLDRKLLETFRPGSMVAQVSETFNMKHVSSKYDSSILLSCIVGYLPLFGLDDLHTETQSRQDYTPGSIKIQMYGPHGVPLNMKLISDAILLQPHTLLPWNDFGFLAKRKFKCSTYNLRSAARQTVKDLPLWTTCDRFILVFHFILEYQELSSYLENEIAFIKEETELLAYIQEICQSTASLRVFKEAALSCMYLLMNQNKQLELELPMSLKRTEKTEECIMYEKMVPEVVNSLIDIFTRSTNTEFRSEVSRLIPTDTRISMSDYLEKKLLRLRRTIPDVSKSSFPFLEECSPMFSNITSFQSANSTVQLASMPMLNDEPEDDVDNWNFTNTCSDQLNSLSTEHLNVCYGLDNNHLLGLSGLSEVHSLVKDDSSINTIPEAGNMANGIASLATSPYNNSTCYKHSNKMSLVSEPRLKESMLTDTLSMNYKTSNIQCIESSTNSKQTMLSQNEDANCAPQFKFSNHLNNLSKNDSVPLQHVHNQSMHLTQDTYNHAACQQDASCHINLPNSNKSGENNSFGSKVSDGYLELLDEEMEFVIRKRMLENMNITNNDALQLSETQGNVKKIKITPYKDILSNMKTQEIQMTDANAVKLDLSLTASPCKCVLQDETEWLDDSEITKWFAEMEN
uniref:Uncharacterized protein n=1 Tax=Biomphalaria glabrata TaxID=6526 RepID=A0A2C9LRP2_BIOGL